LVAASRVAGNPDAARVPLLPAWLAMSTTSELGTAEVAAVQAYLRGTAARGRDTERHGPFLATFSRETDHPFLNYAIPDAGAVPAPDDVAALVAAYRRRNRVPRLELLTAPAPAVEPALLAAGFTVELRPSVMVCRPGEAVPLPVPAGVELLTPTTDADLLQLTAVTREAFGETAPPTADDVRATRRMLAGGGLAVLARDTASGAAAGAGLATEISGGITELAGFGVLHRFRRRGIAGAITGRLVREAHAAGVHTAFLTPGGEEAERVYARAGFAGRTEMLHIRLET
jgi:predicted N-acetyltransferase YhbS